MQRKLSAILSADVVGYSGLMETDEAGTLERLKNNRRKIFDPHVTIHGGRLFKLIGDGALVEFPSVIAAVNCALAIQEATEAAAIDSGETKGIHYRIGINLGEVIIEGDDVYGEGVNLAARLQALAPAGGVALSGVVRDQVEGKAPCVFEDMGEHTVKNIERPVHVFSVRAVGRNAPEGHKVEESRKLSICVLPFANMSDDPQQEYFSDGISEDIITDLSKISALSVIARNTAFTFKGKSVEVPQIAQHLRVSHVLEGSVRKVGGRVRITAQLIDGVSGSHVWAERYDRDLNDIFALQDEISETIVKVLKLKLLPEEKRAIEKRGTDSVAAYRLYLMARQMSIAGNVGNARNQEAIVRLCRRATEIDPSYARAWALMAGSQTNLRLHIGRGGESGLAAAESAIRLDPNLAEAHAARAVVLTHNAQYDEAWREVEIALRLDPESYEVNYTAGRWNYANHRFNDAIRYWEKAARTIETDYASVGMLTNCYTRIGDTEGARLAAERTLARAELIVAKEPDNGSAMSFGIEALATLGQTERAKEWTERAILLDPDNLNMHYNVACGLISHLGENDAALDLLERIANEVNVEALNWWKIDPDLNPVRNDPRFKALMATAEVRLEAGKHRNLPTAP